jgi:hypothetical protein
MPQFYINRIKSPNPIDVYHMLKVPTNQQINLFHHRNRYMLGVRPMSFGDDPFLNIFPGQGFCLITTKIIA